MFYEKTSLLTVTLYILAAVFIFATEYYLAFLKSATPIYYENEWLIHLVVQPIVVIIFTIVICAMGNWPHGFVLLLWLVLESWSMVSMLVLLI